MNDKMQYVITDDPADELTSLEEKVAERVEAGLSVQKKQLKIIKHMVGLKVQEGENKRAMKNRVAKRRKKNKMAAASRKANR